MNEDMKPIESTISDINRIALQQIAKIIKHSEKMKADTVKAFNKRGIYE